MNPSSINSSALCPAGTSSPSSEAWLSALSTRSFKLRWSCSVSRASWSARDCPYASFVSLGTVLVMSGRASLEGSGRGRDPYLVSPPWSRWVPWSDVDFVNIVV